MKKLITLSTILALSVASVVEAKGMRSSRSVSGRTISAPAQPMKMNSQQKQIRSNKHNTMPLSITRVLLKVLSHRLKHSKWVAAV